MATAARSLQNAPARVLVNDVHSRLNATRVARVVEPRDVSEVAAAVRAALREGSSVAIAGGRHAMGGQQFAEGTVLLDMRGLRRVLSLDARAGTVEVEAGIQWPELVRELARLQPGVARPWSIRQKQTGADLLTLGGAVAANVHGRGLTMAPFVSDVESLELVDAAGQTRQLSRTREPDLFALVAGGYGLFGVVTSLTLRLQRRRPLRRLVELTDSERLPSRFEERIAQGCLYGDFQFAVDDRSDAFLRLGILSCYEPADGCEPEDGRADLREDDWKRLIHLAHVAKSEAFARYADHYLRSDGRLYWSDTHQLATYLDGYHDGLDTTLAASARGSEVIAELYVPRAELTAFLADAARELRRHRADVIYGTVRLIERDDESFLAWAREPWACVVVNLHVQHDALSRARADATFRALFDLALARGGSFYLTYGRHATAAQLDAAHPRLREMLREKDARDPGHVFRSTWWQWVRAALGTAEARPWRARER